MTRMRRRDFLRASAAVAASALLPRGARATSGVSLAAPPPAALVARIALPPGREPFDPAAAGRLFDEAMCALTGRETSTDAWKSLFSRGERVGIKLNATTPPAYSRPETVALVLDGLARAGVRPGDILIWERFENDLRDSGFRRALFGPTVRLLSTEPAGLFAAGPVYETAQDIAQERDDGRGTVSRLSELATTRVDKTVNIGAAKDHISAGVTLCMKSLSFGAMDNTRRFHAAPLHCDPAIAECLLAPGVADRCVLSLLDAVHTIYNGGPFHHPQWCARTGRLYLSRDMVALDRVAADDLDLLREEEGFRPIMKTSRPSRHIDTAAARGLGVADRALIRVLEIPGA